MDFFHDKCPPDVPVKLLLGAPLRGTLCSRPNEFTPTRKSGAVVGEVLPYGDDSIVDGVDGWAFLRTVRTHRHPHHRHLHHRQILHRHLQAHPLRDQTNRYPYESCRCIHFP